MRPGDDCVRLSLSDADGGGGGGGGSSLRVRGEWSDEDLRHVLLAKGHQEQGQALIGRVHAAALRTKNKK